MLLEIDNKSTKAEEYIAAANGRMIAKLFLPPPADTKPSSNASPATRGTARSSPNQIPTAAVPNLKEPEFVHLDKLKC